MTRDQYNFYRNLANEGRIDDDDNPALTLNDTSNFLLLMIAKGKLNVQQLAIRELENRGCYINGKWVGFGKEISSSENQEKSNTLDIPEDFLRKSFEVPNQ